MTSYTKSSAVLSGDHAYRYRLDRAWDIGQRVCWVMLNPSTADWLIDDRTIGRCVDYARAWGYDGITVVNLFAYRATDPRDLATAADPIGPEWAQHFIPALDESTLTVAAWGSSYPRGPYREHVDRWARILRIRGARVLGLTKAGDPRHPLYMRSNLQPQLWAA